MWLLVVIAAIVIYVFLMPKVEGFDYNKFKLPSIPRRVVYTSHNLDTEREIGPPKKFETGHVDRILGRVQHVAPKHTANLRPSGTTGLEACSDVTTGECKGHRIETIVREPVLSCVPESHQIYDEITSKQPFIYNDKPYITKEKYYRDWRYPREPLELSFLADPKGYCERYPQRYPCYVRSVRFNVPNPKVAH